MEFKVTEVSNGFIIEDRNGDRAVVSLGRLSKKHEPTTTQPAETSANRDAIISIVEDRGEKWVRVQALGEDFVIGTRDLKDKEGKVMKDCDYDTIMARLNELGLDTFNRKQLFIIGIYINEINEKLVEAGGEKFAKDWYVSKDLWAPVGSCADSVASYAWYFNGDVGIADSSSRCSGNFRCRPVLAYAYQD